MPFIKPPAGPPWRLLVCGDRHWNDFKLIIDTIIAIGVEDIAVIIEGEAPGADTYAREAAKYLGIAWEEYPADWTKYGGKKAGPIRNKQMLVEGKPNRVIAFHDNIKKSKGTANMLAQARRCGLKPEIISHENSAGS